MSKKYHMNENYEFEVLFCIYFWLVFSFIIKLYSY